MSGSFLSYIDNTIENPKNITSDVKWLINELEKYDEKRKTDNILYSGLYFDRLDDLWVNVKNAVAAGAMSEKSWQIIKNKYWTHAEYIDSIIEKEKKNKNENI